MIAPTETRVLTNAPHPKNFTPLVKQFLDYLKLEKHFSDYTVKSYGSLNASR
jgi:site-specific recombinase XerC